MLSLSAAAAAQAMRSSRGAGPFSADAGMQRAAGRDSGGLTHYAGREDIFLESDEATHVFEVVEGIVCLYRILPDGTRHILSFRFPGETVGLCSPSTYAYNAQAVGDVSVRRIPVSGVERMLDERPEFARQLLRMATSELNDARQHLMCLAAKSAESKIADFLLMLAQRGKVDATADKETIEVNLPMTRTDIGDYLGLTIETVSRTLSKLRRSGIIDLPRASRVVVKRLDRLEEMAAG